MLYLIIYFKQFQFRIYFIDQINTFTTYPSLLFNIYFITTTKYGVYLYVKVVRGNRHLHFEIRNVCPESSCFDVIVQERETFCFP